MKTKPSKVEHKRDRLPQIKKGEGAPIHIVLPYGPLADAVEDIDLPQPHTNSKLFNYKELNQFQGGYMEFLSYLLTQWIKTSEAVYRVYPIFNDYGGFDLKWEQVYPIPAAERKQT